MSAERSLGSVRQALALVNTPLGATVKYNPHLWGDDELRAIFVVRQPELAALLDAVRRIPAKSVPQHRLIVGQRGMGKTTLLRLLTLAIRDDAELSRDWLALTFPESRYSTMSGVTMEDIMSTRTGAVVSFRTWCAPARPRTNTATSPSASTCSPSGVRSVGVPRSTMSHSSLAWWAW
jgi:hypothetical protein